MSPDSAPKKFEAVRPAGLRFVGEQDGPTERVLKTRLREVLDRSRNMEAAYLCRANLDQGPESVILALRTASGPNTRIVEDIGKIFASTFARSEHLDILFVTDEQEGQLKQVCTPFYLRSH
jgi:hypothetical protein